MIPKIFLTETDYDSPDCTYNQGVEWNFIVRVNPTGNFLPEKMDIPIEEAKEYG
jgi:hypothetical protein